MEKYVLCGCTLLEGTELNPLHDACVVVANGKIEKITTQESFFSENTEQCKKIDLGRYTLMPGLIECHSHVALDARLPDHLEMMNASECELTVTAIKALRDDLMSGVTTARCMGDRHYIDVILREKVRQGILEGPDLLVSGIGMRGLHGHGYVGIAHTGVEEFRRTARENMKRGVDLLKIFVTAGCPPIDGGFVPSFVSPEEIHTVVEEGKRLNLPTAAHCIGGQGLRDCVNMGVEVIEHAYAVTDDDVELLEKVGCWVDLTSGIFMDESREAFLSTKSAENTRKCRENVIRSLEKIVKSGINFSLGTDAYHTFLYREVGYAVELGATVRNALKGVTSNAAKVCGISEHTGSLAVGMSADIIAVEGNPLENTRALADVRCVIKHGIVQHFSTRTCNRV